MMYKQILAFSIVTVAITACGSTNSSSNSAGSRDTAPSPVESRSPNSGYKPAFSGQTRVTVVTTTTPYEATILSSALNKPWGLKALPDGRFLITEKAGTMRLVSQTGTVSAAITGLPPVDAKGQGGLLGVTIDPAFTTNRMVYWTFSHPVSPGNLTAVGKGRLSNDETRIENAQVIYQATPGYDGDKHYGSRILFDRTGHLIVSTGERSDRETRPQAQSLQSALGKLIRITTDGQPAAGNPFINNSNARPEFYSYGHRNPQGLALHPETGEVWESEMGPRGGDEVNRIQPGKNYGWPTITYGLEYSGAKVGEGISQQAGMEQPVYYWDPVLSPSGMTFYGSSTMPEWKNNLFIGGLNSNHIARLVIKNNKVVGEERMLAKEGQRFRDITEGKDGALYAVTDAGRLYRVGKK